VKTVVVLFDSLRRDYVGPYSHLDLEGGLGKEKIRTPNLDRFSGRGDTCIFNRAYVNSHPTGPFRRDVWTGKMEFPHRGWGPLKDDDLTFARLLGEEGVVSMMITDTYGITDSSYGIQRSYTEAPPGNTGNYQGWFTGWDLIRGHQSDRWWPADREVELPCAPEKLRGGKHRMKLYLEENYGRRFEEDWSVAQVFRRAANWLEENYQREDFLLWIDSFTPHEPYDPPPYYEEMYDPGYEGERVIFPRYGDTDYLEEEELDHIKAMYAGSVTLADRWFGHLTDSMEKLGLLDDEETMIIVTSDHGHLLGDHGLVGKPGLGSNSEAFLWEGIADIPLIVRHPGCETGETSSLVSAVDLFSTLMDHMGGEIPQGVEGDSLLPLIRGEKGKVKEMAVFGRHGDSVNVTDGRFVLFLVDKEKGLGASRLYDLQKDPRQERNALEENRDKAEEMRDFAHNYLRRVGAEKSVLNDVRRGL